MTTMLNGLPVYKMVLSDDETLTGVEFISMVESPAIESNFVAFNKNKIKFATDKVKQNLTGAFMIPDLPIYRYDDKNGEYYVVFTKEEIEKIATRFLKQQKTLNINYEHQDNSKVDAVIIESWFTSKTDKTKDLGFDFPEGTWAGTVHVEDNNFWSQEVETGNVKGFSIEGYLDLKMNKINKIKMNKIKFEAQAKTKDGVILFTPADAFAEGVEIYIVDAEGNQSAAADADYEMEDGSIITVASGKVSKLIVAQAQSEQTEEVKHALTPEDMQAIADVVNKINADLITRIEALEKEVETLKGGQAEMSKKFSMTPGSQSLTTNTDDNKTENKKVKMSIEEKVSALQALIKNVKK